MDFDDSRDEASQEVPEFSIQVKESPRRSVAERRGHQAFHGEIKLLGGAWVLLGVLTFGMLMISLFATSSGPQHLLPLHVVGLGLAFVQVILGLATYQKNIGAVCAGLVLSYLILAYNLLILNVCGMMVWLPVVVLAHRVIYLYSQMDAAGISSGTRPRL